jgi:hypothetical protein
VQAQIAYSSTVSTDYAISEGGLHAPSLNVQIRLIGRERAPHALGASQQDMKFWPRKGKWVLNLQPRHTYAARDDVAKIDERGAR